jgi:carboxymethylenebutenolidase
MIDINNGEFSGYVAEPRDTVRGGLIVIHEIWGLVDHIKDVADRLARHGYLVVAPDLLTGIGTSPEVGQELLRIRNSGSASEQSRLQPMMREKLALMQSPEFARWAVSALQRTVDYVAERPGVEDRIGVLGFCFGGSYSFALAAADSRIRVVVPFYGQPPELADVGKIACPCWRSTGTRTHALPAICRKSRRRCQRPVWTSPLTSIRVSGTRFSMTRIRGRMTRTVPPTRGVGHWQYSTRAFQGAETLSAFKTTIKSGRRRHPERRQGSAGAWPRTFCSVNELARPGLQTATPAPFMARITRRSSPRAG